MYFATCLDNNIISTAPIAKFGAMKTGVSNFSEVRRIFSLASSLSPVVPITGDTLCSSAIIALLNTTLGCVKSTITSGLVFSIAFAKSVSMTMPFLPCPVNSPVSAPPITSTAPTSSNSSSFMTALTTVRPILPYAPLTSTLIIPLTSTIVINSQLLILLLSQISY